MTESSFIYDFTGKDIYCFSDLEGFMPNGLVKTLFGIDVDESANKDKGFITAYETLKDLYFPLEEKKGVQNSKNELRGQEGKRRQQAQAQAQAKREPKRQKPQPSYEIAQNSPNPQKQKGEFNLSDANNAIVFTGDLIDREGYCIRLLHFFHMLKTYKNNKKFVMLCGGNRDFNKIRMYEECYFVKNGAGEVLPWDETMKTEKDFYEFCVDVATNFSTKYKFKNTAKDLAPALTGTQAWDNTVINTVFTDDLSRIEKIYVKTLGAGTYLEKVVEEVRSIFGVYFSPPQQNLNLAVIAILNMIMGFVWDEKDLPPLFQQPKYKFLNGLYVKYLENAHIIACFNAGNKHGIASHSGVPFNGGTFSLGFPIGTKDQTTTDDLKNVFQTIENEKTEYLKLLHHTNPNLKDIRKNITPMIHMTAGVGPVGDRDHDYSPIYQMTHIDQKGPQKLKDKDNNILGISWELSGGGVYKFNSDIKNIYSGETYYNIFGHQPCGFVPIISKVPTANVYHVCLDISKAESFGITNIEAYTVLIIRSNDDKVKIHFKPNIEDKSIKYFTQEGYAIDPVFIETEDLLVPLSEYVNDDNSKSIQLLNKDKTPIKYFNNILQKDVECNSTAFKVKYRYYSHCGFDKVIISSQTPASASATGGKKKRTPTKSPKNKTKTKPKTSFPDKKKTK